jgi:transposase InsO family protein
MRRVRTSQPRGQRWATFLRNHAAEIWACDFLQVTDLFFRPLFAFFIIELKSRRVIHIGVTRSPTDPWVAHQLREATPYGQAPKYLVCDNDSKFGPGFARVATTSTIEILNTPYHAPRANAICERFVRSVRQECASPPVDPSREAAPAGSLWVCGVLQSGTAASRDQAYRFQNRMLGLLHQIMMVAKSSPARSWVDYTTTTEESREVWKTC